MTENGVPAPLHEHDAFISYNWSSSRAAARKLQAALEGVWRRSGLEPPMRLFRDETGQQFGGLSSTLESHLVGSRWLVAVLHRETAKSVWMNFEIDRWLQGGGDPGRIVLVRIDPTLDLSWDETRHGFHDPSALLPVLADAFTEEPFYLDLKEGRLGRLADPTGDLARLSATIMERDPAEVLQRELRVQRRQKRRAVGVLTVLAMLVVLAVAASVVAVRSRDVAQRQRTEAEAQALAAEAMLSAVTRPDQSIRLLEDAAARSSDRSVRLAIYSVLNANPRLSRVIGTDVLGGVPDDLEFDARGEQLAAWRTLPGGQASRLVVWDAADGSVRAAGEVPGAAIERIAFVDKNTVALCREDGSSIATFAAGTTAAQLDVTTVGRDQDSCHLLPMALGAMLVDVRDDEATAELVGPGGRSTDLGRTGFAITTPDADRVLTTPPTGPWQIASATGRVSLVPKTDSLDIDAYLGGGRGEPWFLRLSSFMPVKVDPLDPGRGVQELPVPPNVTSVASLPGARGGMVWVNDAGTVGWTLNGRTVDLTDDDLRVPPALWVTDSGKIIVDLFERAVGLEVAGNPGKPRLRVVKSIDVDWNFSDRSGTVPPSQTGRDGVFLPRGESATEYFDGETTSDFDGVPIFDATGTSALLFDGGSISVATPGASSETVHLDTSGSAKAAAITGSGDLVAVVRAGSPISIYRTDSTLSAPSLVKGRIADWSTGDGFSGVEFHPQHGSDVVRVAEDGTTTTYPSVFGEVSGWYAVHPAGDEILVMVSGGPVGDGHLALAKADGDIGELPANGCAIGEGELRYLPGADFRQSAAAAQSPVLVQVHDEAEDHVTSCLDPAAGPDTAAADEVLSYEMRGSRGRILARSPDDGALQWVTWSGDHEPTVLALPDTDASTSAVVNPAGTDAVTWDESTGSVGWLAFEAGAWKSRSSAHFGLEDVVWGAVEPSAGVAMLVSGAGEIEVVDFATGRTVLQASAERSFGLEISTQAVGQLDFAEGAFQVFTSAGNADGLKTSGSVTTLPWKVSLLRKELCAIAPRPAPVCPSGG